MNSLRADERGFTFVHVAALIVGPLIILAIAGTAISATRTGTGLTSALTRTTQTQQVFDAFKTSIGASSALTVTSTSRVQATIDPAKRPPNAGLGMGPAGTACATSTWELTAQGDLQTLTETRATHASTCSSAVVRTKTQHLTGLTAETAFVFVNRAGRTLIVGDAGVTGVAAQPKPAGVTDHEWNATEVGAITIAGVAQDMFTDRDVQVTAFATQVR